MSEDIIRYGGITMSMTEEEYKSFNYSKFDEPLVRTKFVEED